MTRERRGCKYKTVVGYNALKGNAYFGSLKTSFIVTEE